MIKEIFSNFLGNKANESFRQQRNMVVYQCISIIGRFISINIFELSNKMLYVQKLLSLHPFLNIDVVFGQIVNACVYPFGKYANRPIFLKSIYAYSSQICAAILDEWYWDTQSNKPNLFEGSGLHEVMRFFTEGEAMRVELDQVCKVKKILHITLDSSFRLQLQEGVISFDGQSASLVNLDGFPSLIWGVGNVQKCIRHFQYSSHGVVFIQKVIFQFVLLTERSKIDALIDQQFAFGNKNIQNLIVEERNKALTLSLLRQRGNW